MHEVVGSVHAFERRSKAPRIEHVGADEFSAFVEDMAKELGVPREAADAHAGALSPLSNLPPTYPVAPVSRTKGSGVTSGT